MFGPSVTTRLLLSMSVVVVPVQQLKRSIVAILSLHAKVQLAVDAPRDALCAGTVGLECNRHAFAGAEFTGFAVGGPSGLCGTRDGLGTVGEQERSVTIGKRVAATYTSIRATCPDTCALRSEGTCYAQALSRYPWAQALEQNGDAGTANLGECRA